MAWTVNEAMDKHFNRITLGLSAEYAVASELCRRGVYAQLTLGHQKRADLLILSDSDRLARVEVKAKQGDVWPNCKGISGSNALMVFVDYQRCKEDKRPAFFVLSSEDWRKVLEASVAQIRKKNPQRRITITADNIAVFEDEIGQDGKPYKGIEVWPSDIGEFHECWEKITQAVTQ